MSSSDWSSDVCSSDLEWHGRKPGYDDANQPQAEAGVGQQPPGTAEAVRGHLLHCRSGSAAPAAAWDQRVDRKRVVAGKSGSVRVDLGGRRRIKKTKKNRPTTHNGRQQKVHITA